MGTFEGLLELDDLLLFDISRKVKSKQLHFDCFFILQCFIDIFDMSFKGCTLMVKRDVHKKDFSFDKLFKLCQDICFIFFGNYIFKIGWQCNRVDIKAKNIV